MSAPNFATILRSAQTCNLPMIGAAIFHETTNWRDFQKERKKRIFQTRMYDVGFEQWANSPEGKFTILAWDPSHKGHCCTQLFALFLFSKSFIFVFLKTFSPLESIFSTGKPMHKWGCNKISFGSFETPSLSNGEQHLLQSGYLLVLAVQGGKGNFLCRIFRKR